MLPVPLLVVIPIYIRVSSLGIPDSSQFLHHSVLLNSRMLASLMGEKCYFRVVWFAFLLGVRLSIFKMLDNGTVKKKLKQNFLCLPWSITSTQLAPEKEMSACSDRHLEQTTPSVLVLHMDSCIQIHKPLNDRHCVSVLHLRELRVREGTLPEIRHWGLRTLVYPRAALSRVLCLFTVWIRSFVCCSHWIYAFLPGLAISPPHVWFGRMYVFFNVALVHCFFL